MPEHAPFAHEIAAAVNGGSMSAAATIEAALARLTDVEPLGALLQACPDYARRRAAALDDARRRGESCGPMAGVPIVLKDNLCTTFADTTCGSRILRGYRSPYDATVVRRLEAAGAIVIAKTNCDEFAMGSSTENSAYRPALNPWDRTRVPGGSSGGSAVCVAARTCPVALGSDTGGSIRQPASFCGVFGLKPTYGRVSRFGLVAYGSSLDQIGPFATCVADAAAVLSAIAGRDEADSTSSDAPVEDYAAALADARLSERRASLRVGVPAEFFGEGLDAEVRAAVEAAIDVYRRLGAQIVPVSFPRLPACVATYYVVAMAEASSNLARYDGVHYGHRTDRPENVEALYSRSRAEGFGAEVKRRLMLGAFALSAGYHDAYYTKALQVRRLIKQDFDAAFAQCDVIAGPVAPTAAFKLGERVDDPLKMYLEDVYTVPVNLAGLPAASVPCGFTRAGLPVGLQLIAPPLAETVLLQTARLFERETDWHTRRPI